LAVAGFKLLLSNVVSLKFGPVDFKAIIISAPASTSAALLSQSSLGKIYHDLSITPMPWPQGKADKNQLGFSTHFEAPL
jgi:hypothetical protein